MFISSYNSGIIVHHLGKQSRSLWAGTEAEGKEKQGCLPAYCSWLPQPAFYTTQDYILKAVYRSGLGPLPSIINQENITQT